MTSLNATVTVTGARQAATLAERLATRLDDGTPALRSLVDDLVRIEQGRFKGQGTRWRKIKRVTQARDRRRDHRVPAGRPSEPVVLTGRLRDSLTSVGARGQVVEVRRDSLKFGTTVFYAKFQKKLGRNPVGATRQQRVELVAALSDFLLDR